MITSPYEWKIPEWAEKLQTNKQTKTIVESNKQTHRQTEADRQLQELPVSQKRNTSLEIDWNSYESVFCENVELFLCLKLWEIFIANEFSDDVQSLNDILSWVHYRIVASNVYI